MIRLNAPKGLGDAIHLRIVAVHLVARGEAVEVFTRWPEVLDGVAGVTARLPGEIDDYGLLRPVVACYHCRLPQVRALSAFENACLQAGVSEPVAFRIDWPVRNLKLVDSVIRAAAGRPILIFQSPRLTHNPQQEAMVPARDAFNHHLRGRSNCFRVRIGHPAFVADDPEAPRDLDLFGRTTVADVFDVATIASLTVSAASFLPILAQALDKPFVWMFSRRAEASPYPKVANMTPERMIHKPALATVIYDEQGE